MAVTSQTPPTPPDHRPLRLLLLGLVIVGLLTAAWRHLAEPEVSTAPGDHLWEVEMHIEADTIEGQTSVSIATPLGTRYLRAVGQSISHPGWRQSPPVVTGMGASRRITLVAARTGRLSVDVAFSVHQSATERLLAGAGTARLEAETRETFLRDHPILGIEDPAVTELIARLSSDGAADGALVDAIFTFVLGLGERSDQSLLNVPDLLGERRANPRERAYTMVALSRAARIPARLVKGFVLREADSPQLHFWMEAHLGGQWVPFDPAFKHRGELPPNYLPFVKGIKDVVGFSDTTDFTVGYAISNTDPLMDSAAPDARDWRAILDLSRLSLDTRVMLAALMLLPFGVLITAICSEFIGLRFYGVFTPALLAMSLVYIPWQSAAVVLGVVLLLGVLGRSVAPRKLARTPRLSVVFTLVALSIAISASLMDYFDIRFGGEVVLLPIVVLAAIVDRFYAVLDENGPRTAVCRLGWTLAVAVVCMPVIRYEALGHAMIRYPELHLLTIAAILGLTRVRHRRLSQYPAFRWLECDQRKAVKP